MIGPIRASALAFLIALLATLAEAIRRRSVPAVVNASLSLCVALLPLALDLVLTQPVAWSAESGPTLTVWMAVAGLLHSVGMLGLYESTDWWDHLTHACSAALLAALVYACVLVVAQHGALPGGERWVGLVTVLVVLLAGVCWELGELFARDVGNRYGIEPVLVYYGPADTALDLVFDLLGVLAVVSFDLRLFVALAAPHPQTATQLFYGTVALLVVLTVGFAVVLTLVFDDEP
jgi:CDP-diglyceride synthetase